MECVKMKCAFCREEFEGNGYRISNDMRIRGAKLGVAHPISVIKELGNVCSRECQIASKVAFVVHSSPMVEDEPDFNMMFEYCKCTEEEFTKGMEKYDEIMARNVYMMENDYEKDL
jgi:hypothetical protein